MRAPSGLLSCALLLALASCASQRPAPNTAPRPAAVISAPEALVLSSFDANADARVDAAELTAGIDREWARADVDRDNALTPLEFNAWAGAVLGGPNAAPFRLDFDRNVDNAITREEFVTEWRARARDADADHDGVLLRSEFVREAPRPAAPRQRPAMRMEDAGPNNPSERPR